MNFASMRELHLASGAKIIHCRLLKLNKINHCIDILNKPDSDRTDTNNKYLALTINMKILIPVLGFGRAGGYRVLSELANSWLAQGHEVDFLCPVTSQEPYFPTTARILWVNGFGHLSKCRDSKSANLKSMQAHKNLMGLYLGLCARGAQYNIILANHSLTAWPVALAACSSARKFYYVQAYEPEYYELETGWRSRILRHVSKYSYKFPLRQICNAPVYIGYNEISAKDWVPPGIDPNNFFPKKTHKSLNTSSEIIIGCIGRSEPGKGIRYVLEAFEHLWKRDPRFRLRIAYGNLPPDWQHPALEIVVPKDDRELGEYYRSLDIMIAPGTVQLGAPHYPVIEAMACSVPVVTTGYIPASEQNAWIVPICDSQAIVGAIEKIISSSPVTIDVFLKRAVTAVECFQWKHVSQKFLNLFEAS